MQVVHSLKYDQAMLYKAWPRGVQCRLCSPPSIPPLRPPPSAAYVFSGHAHAHTSTTRMLNMIIRSLAIPYPVSSPQNSMSTCILQTGGGVLTFRRIVAVLCDTDDSVAQPYMYISL